MFNASITYGFLLWNKKIECKYHIQINFGEKKKKLEFRYIYKKKNRANEQ